MRVANYLYILFSILFVGLLSIIIYQDIQFQKKIEYLDNKIEYYKQYQFNKNNVFKKQHQVFIESHKLMARHLVAKENHIKKQTKVQYFNIWFN